MSSISKSIWLSSLLILCGCAYRSPEPTAANRSHIDTVLVTIHDTITHNDTLVYYTGTIDSLFQAIEIEQTQDDIDHIQSDLDTIIRLIEEGYK